MADSDKQFRISILIDGAEQAVKTTGETKQAFDDLAKTIGTASSSGGTGLTQNVAALEKATEAQAKASGISYEALKKETEALRENSKAKRENADSAGDGSSGRPALSAKDQAALDVRDFNAVVEAAEKKAADLAAKTGGLRQTASEAAKAFGEIAGSIPGLEGVGKSFAKLENPIGLIVVGDQMSASLAERLADLLKLLHDTTDDGEQTKQIAELISQISQERGMRDNTTLNLLSNLQSDTLSKGQQFGDLTRRMDMLVSQTKANQIALDNMAKNQESLRRMIGMPGPMR